MGADINIERVQATLDLEKLLNKRYLGWLGITP